MFRDSLFLVQHVYFWWTLLLWHYVAVRLQKEISVPFITECFSNEVRVVVGTAGWPRLWFGNKQLMRSPPLKELWWVERQQSLFHAVMSSVVQTCPRGECSFLLRPCLEKGTGYWRIREWKGLSLLRKNGLNKIARGMNLFQQAVTVLFLWNWLTVVPGSLPCLHFRVLHAVVFPYFSSRNGSD